MTIGRGVFALMASLLLAACGGPPPPPAPVEGAAVGHVLTRGDEPLSTVGGPGRASEGAVFAVPVDTLEDLWRAGPSGALTYEQRRMVQGCFETSAAAVRDAGGDLARLDDEASFVLEVEPGEHLLCFTRSPRDDGVGPDGCALTTLPEPPVQLRFWIGEHVSVEQL